MKTQSFLAKCSVVTLCTGKKRNNTSGIMEEHNRLHLITNGRRTLHASPSHRTFYEHQVVLCCYRNKCVAFLRSMRRRGGVPAQSCITYGTSWMHDCNPESWQMQHFTRSIASHLARQLVDISTQIAICSRNPSYKPSTHVC